MLDGKQLGKLLLSLCDDKCASLNATKYIKQNKKEHLADK